MSTAIRVILSVLVVSALGLFERVATVGGSLISGQTAATQFEDADSPAILTNLQAHYLNGSTPVAFGIALLVLALLWAGPISRRFTAAVALGLLALGAMHTDPALAYYNTKDYPEYIEIAPNQTAFLIPEQGANKSSQAAFMSEQYLIENKVAMKRVQIPHTLIRNPGWSYDYFVPAARLLVVDRAPASREWVTSETRGTAKVDQGFRFETADSINGHTGVVISAFVKEEDAAKFVYWFGAKQQPGNLQDPEVNFASVTYGRSLAEVVDENVHRAVQAHLSSEIGSRTTDDVIHNKQEIMNKVEAAVKAQFAPMGITISTLGYAEAITWENAEVQHAIDETFIAQKQSQSATARQATLAIQQQVLDLKIREMDAQARQTLAGKWNGNAAGVIPSVWLAPEQLMNWFKGLFTSVTAPAADKVPAKS